MSKLKTEGDVIKSVLALVLKRSKKICHSAQPNSFVTCWLAIEFAAGCLAVGVVDASCAFLYGNNVMKHSAAMFPLIFVVCVRRNFDVCALFWK